MAPKAPPATPTCFTHGPVVGIILQQVHIGAFAETNISGAPTNLAFGSRLRDSAVTELGYQASVNLGVWVPLRQGRLEPRARRHEQTRDGFAAEHYRPELLDACGVAGAGLGHGDNRHAGQVRISCQRLRRIQFRDRPGQRHNLWRADRGERCLSAFVCRCQSLSSSIFRRRRPQRSIQ